PSFSAMRLRLEAVVHAGPQHVQAHVDVGRHAAGHGVAGRVAETGVEILGLGRPVAGDRGFNAAADGPADIGVACTRETGAVGLDVAERAAGREVRHDAVPGIANAAADRPEPGVLALAHGRRGAGMAAADAAPVDVAFEAEHP